LSHLLAPLPALDHHRYSCLPVLRQVSYLGTYFPSLGTYFSVPSHLTHLALVPKVPSLPNTGDTPPELFTRAVRISTCSCLPIHPPILPILLPFIPFPIFPDFYPSPSFLTIYTTTTATTFSSYSPYRKISAPTASPGDSNRIAVLVTVLASAASYKWQKLPSISGRGQAQIRDNPASKQQWPLTTAPAATPAMATAPAAAPSRNRLSPTSSGATPTRAARPSPSISPTRLPTIDAASPSQLLASPGLLPVIRFPTPCAEAASLPTPIPSTRAPLTMMMRPRPTPRRLPPLPLSVA
jgi:hypothetical protein